MDRQMVFEEFADPPTEGATDALVQLPAEHRDRLVGLLAELMSRAMTPPRRQAPTAACPAPTGREHAGHE